MDAKYPFPDDIRDPNRTEPNPFAAEDPTLDVAPVDAEGAYAAGTRSMEYKPQYDSVLSDRSRMTMILGVLGLLASLSGWLSVVDYVTYAILSLMPLLAVAGSLPAFLMSLSDVRAMGRGAMKDDNRKWSSLACLLGAVGLTSGVLYLIYWVSSAWYTWW